jgi:hypothetical protein
MIMFTILLISIFVLRMNTKQLLHGNEGAIALIVVLVCLLFPRLTITQLDFLVKNSFSDDFDVLMQGLSFYRGSSQYRHV